MTNIHRERWDARANPKSIKEFDVDSAVAIEVGDIVCQVTDDARPASNTGLWTGGAAGTRGNVAMKFVGIAMSSKSSTSATGKVRVAGKGVFSMPVNTGTTFEIGDLVGAVQDGSNSYMLAQQVMKVTDPAEAIGKVVKRYSVATSIVEFEILSNADAGGGFRAFLTS